MKGGGELNNYSLTPSVPGQIHCVGRSQKRVLFKILVSRSTFYIFKSCYVNSPANECYKYSPNAFPFWDPRLDLERKRGGTEKKLRHNRLRQRRTTARGRYIRSIYPAVGPSADSDLAVSKSVPRVCKIVLCVCFGTQ